MQRELFVQVLTYDSFVTRHLEICIFYVYSLIDPATIMRSLTCAQIILLARSMFAVPLYESLTNIIAAAFLVQSGSSNLTDIYLFFILLQSNVI